MTEIKLVADLPAVDIGTIGVNTFKLSNGEEFTAEVISNSEDYVAMLESMFDWSALKTLFGREDFKFTFDGLNGVAGPYAKAIFQGILGCGDDSLVNCSPLPDFGGLHPDPNLTYASGLVKKMGLTRSVAWLSRKR